MLNHMYQKNITILQIKPKYFEEYHVCLYSKKSVFYYTDKCFTYWSM